MKKKNIYIYDDEERFSSQLRTKLEKLNALKSKYEVFSLPNSDFKLSIDELSQRQRSFRKEAKLNSGGSTPIDEADIFIIDFDLVDSIVGQLITGESVAYLARCFSSCGLIIGLNLPPNRNNGFDLTLRGHPDSFADLNIGSAQLTNLSLWETEVDDFRPWYWPILPTYLKNFIQKIKDVESNLSKPIGEIIGFPSPESLDMLPRTLGQFIGKRPSKVTPYDFVINSGNGLRPKDFGKAAKKDINEDVSSVVSRVAAARLSKWLERLILPGQDILVDAPHLISRYPSLLKGSTADINNWNKAASITGGNIKDSIKQFKLKREHWLSRPAWFWDSIREHEEILEVKEPWKIKQVDWVFCEDASRFYKKDQVKEFQAEVDSPFNRRYIKHFSQVEYYPLYRLSL